MPSFPPHRLSGRGRLEKGPGNLGKQGVDQPGRNLRCPGINVELRIQLGDVHVQQLSARGHLPADRADHRQRHAIRGGRAHPGRHRRRHHVQVDGQVQDVHSGQEVSDEYLRGFRASKSSSSRYFTPSPVGRLEQRSGVVRLGNPDDGVLQFRARGSFRAGHLQERRA